MCVTIYETGGEKSFGCLELKTLFLEGFLIIIMERGKRCFRDIDFTADFIWIGRDMVFKIGGDFCSAPCTFKN